MSSRIRLSIVAILALSLLAAGSSSALAGGSNGSAAGKPGKGAKGGKPTPSKTALRLKGLRGGKVTVGNKVKVAGTLRPFAGNQKVTVLLHRGRKTVASKKVTVRRKNKQSKLGKFDFSKRLIKPGRYSIEATHAKTGKLGGSKAKSRSFKIRYPDLGPRASGGPVQLFNKLLGDLGYVNDEGSSYDFATERAVLAFHKVNKEALKVSSSSSMFKKLAKGKGGYKLKHPGDGKHVETDLSRQVMVLAKGGKPDEIYSVSTGKSTTPTILGKFHFYRKDPGYNSIGMYYSVYFLRGYATHGYESVPDYPASHGCIRNPIPDSKHIYDWIDIGDPIYVYH